jgi:Tfp pilus assembly protein PilZ
MAKKERRRKKRLAVTAKIKISGMDKKSSRSVDAYFLEAKDMTQKGLFLKTQRPLPLGTELKLEIMLGPGLMPVMADARVAWIARPSHIGYYPGMGVSITKIKRGDSRQITEFLKDKFRNYRDALELKKMYMQLKEMAARLYDLERSHMQAEHFRKVVDHAINEIDNVAHILDKEVWEIKRL